MVKFVGVDRALQEVTDLIAPLEEAIQQGEASPGVLIDLAQVKATVALVSAVTALANIIDSKS